MTIALAMLARDEADTLPRSLASALPHVDHALIIDTGSEDETRDIVRQNGCELVDRPWVNFAHNRTELLREASRRADQILMLDADMAIDPDGRMPDTPADCHMAYLHFSGLRYRLPFLIDAHKPWTYKGAAHAYLDCQEPISRQDCDTFTVTHFGPGATREKLERDLALLRQEAEPRSLFYLAQTFKDLGMVDDAIRHYKARAELSGFEEERFYSLYQAGSLLCRHRDFAEGAALLIKAWQLRPCRAEPLRALAYAANGIANKIPMPPDSLFISEDTYKPHELREAA